MKYSRTERGWAGHFILGHACGFRRNTLLKVDGEDYGIVISTVGACRPDSEKPCVEIGHNRFYETLIFKAHEDGIYWEADISSGEQPYPGRWSVDNLEDENVVNDMHEEAVDFFMRHFALAEDVAQLSSWIERCDEE